MPKKIVETKIENGISYRKCNQCLKFKTVDNYYSNCKNNPNWIDSVCKCCRKDKSTKRQVEFREDINAKSRKKILDKNGLKSPFNYIGNKYSLLKDIKELLPNNINTFVDLFCGSTTVAINVEADKYICNDSDNNVINFLNKCKELNSDEICNRVQAIIDEFQANTEDGYVKLRDYFNNTNNDWDIYYALLCNSFNQHLQYNKNGKVDTGYGLGVTNFNFILKKRIKEYIDRINSIHIEFTNYDYKNMLDRNFNKNDFVFIDPPYLISSMNYFSRWNKDDELYLLNKLDELNDKGIKFMLCNVLSNKGKTNDILEQWRTKYNTTYVNNDFNRISKSHDKDNDVIEVLITN